MQRNVVPRHKARIQTLFLPQQFSPIRHPAASHRLGRIPASELYILFFFSVSVDLPSPPRKHIFLTQSTSLLFCIPGESTHQTESQETLYSSSLTSLPMGLRAFPGRPWAGPNLAVSAASMLKPVPSEVGVPTGRRWAWLWVDADLLPWLLLF